MCHMQKGGQVMQQKLRKEEEYSNIFNIKFMGNGASNAEPD